MSYSNLSPAPVFTGRSPGGIPSVRTTVWDDPLVAQRQALRGLGFELPSFIEDWDFEDEEGVAPGFKDTTTPASVVTPEATPVKTTPSPGPGSTSQASPPAPLPISPPVNPPPADGLSTMALVGGGVVVVGVLGTLVYLKKRKKT